MKWEAERWRRGRDEDMEVGEEGRAEQRRGGGVSGAMQCWAPHPRHMHACLQYLWGSSTFIQQVINKIRCETWISESVFRLGCKFYTLSEVLTCVGTQTLACVGAPGWQAELWWTLPQEGVFCLGEREDDHLAPPGACGASAALTIGFHSCPAGVSLSKSCTHVLKAV